LIVGAGIIGVEIGSIYSRLGSEVVFLEFLDRICPTLDSAIAKALQKSLTNQGMLFHLSHRVTGGVAGEKGVTLTAQGPEGEKSFSADAVLVCIGRRPYSDQLGLESVGIAKNAKGFVSIDTSFRTSQPHIFAIGDLIEGPMLAHKASEEGIAVAELIAGHRPTLDYLAIPNVVYTHPEVASAGFTEEELKGYFNESYRVAQFPFKANSRARCIGDEEGFVKIIADVPSHRLLGLHIFGPHASELIAEGALALTQRLTVDALVHTCHAHPTLSEAIKEAAHSLFQAPIHL
jgi:dihydrolipoamide dehydrogenase